MSRVGLQGNSAYKRVARKDEGMNILNKQEQGINFLLGE